MIPCVIVAISCPVAECLFRSLSNVHFIQGNKLSVASILIILRDYRNLCAIMTTLLLVRTY